MPPINQIILAIDPGFDRIGWAVGTKNHAQIKLMDYGLIQTNRDFNLHQRYQQISDQITTIIDKFQPNICAIEKLFFSRNKTTALKVSEARGVIINTCLNLGLSISEYTPNQIKLAATGSGTADKVAIEKMIRSQLNLTHSKIIDDVCDALAILLTATNYNNLLS